MESLFGPPPRFMKLAGGPRGQTLLGENLKRFSPNVPFPLCGNNTKEQRSMARSEPKGFPRLVCQGLSFRRDSFADAPLRGAMSYVVPRESSGLHTSSAHEKSPWGRQNENPSRLLRATGVFILPRRLAGTTLREYARRRNVGAINPSVHESRGVFIPRGKPV